MAVVKAIFTNFLAFIMSFILTAFPYAGFKAPVIKTLNEDCLLNVQLMADTHIEEKELARQFFLKQSLKKISRAKSPVDAVLVAGDVTNYADEPSLAKFFDICSEYSTVPVIAAAGNHDIGHAGDRDKTDISREEAMANFIRYRNEYMGRSDTVNYFSTEIKGYTFIVLGDEVIDGGAWDEITMSPEQLDFLDRELARATADGKPAFVCSHWPIQGTNGEDTIWPGSGVPTDVYDIKSILEKYDNVFYVSGHMHAGIKSQAVEKLYGLSNAERVNGVTYINLPTLGIVNSFGVPFSGIGAQLEVYENEVIFRPRNLITNKWFANSEFRFDLV